MEPFFLPNVGFRESTYSHTRESLLTCQCVGECLAQWCTRNTGCICKASGLAQYYRGILAATPESHPFEGVSELVWEKHPIWSNSSYQFVTYSLQHTNFIVGLDSLYDPVCFLLFLHHSYSWPSWPRLLGHEWDEDLDNGFRPQGLIRLSETHVDNVQARAENAITTRPRSMGNAFDVIYCEILWYIVIYFFFCISYNKNLLQQLVLSSLCFCFDFIPQDPLDQDQTGAGPCIASWALGGHGAAERCLYLPSSRFQTESFGDCSICWFEADEWARAKSYVCCGWPTSQQGFFWTSLPNTSETWPGSGCFGQPPPDTTLCSCAWRQWNLRRLADCTGVRSRPCWFQRRDTPLHCLPKLTDGNGHEALEAWSFFGCERHVWRSSATVFCQSYFSKSLHGEAGRNPRDDELAKEAKARASRRSAPLEAVQRGLILAVHRPQCDDSMGISRWGCSRWENSRGKVQRDPGREWWLHRHRPATRSNSKDPCSGAGICFGSCGLSPRAPHAPGYGTWRMGRLFWSPCERGWCPQIDLQFIEKGFRYAVAHLLCRGAVDAFEVTSILAISMIRPWTSPTWR